MLSRFVSAIIQLWLRITGRKRKIAEYPWLNGPQGGNAYIGENYYSNFAAANGYITEQPAGGGLLPDFDVLSKTPQPQLHPRIKHFYEHTAEYTLDVWSEWYYPIKPFAWLLIRIVSHEINQLNIPLHPLDTSRGMSNDVILLRRPDAPLPELVCWLRKSLLKNRVVYSGFYAAMQVNGEEMVRVVFPLPKGNVTVMLHPEYLPDGSFKLISNGKGFGKSGYYRLHHYDENTVKVRRIPLHEIIHVFVSPDGELRTDHEFRFWGIRFLKLHYRMRLKT